jgi:ATP-dependent exoDNAse (exonuclease V) alpha subunit
MLKQLNMLEKYADEQKYARSSRKNVKLATLITVHKAQGLSLQSALIDAGPTTFGSGMTYVALSHGT